MILIRTMLQSIKKEGFSFVAFHEREATNQNWELFNPFFFCPTIVVTFAYEFHTPNVITIMRQSRINLLPLK